MPATPRSHHTASLRLVAPEPVRGSKFSSGERPSRAAGRVPSAGTDASGRFVLMVRALAAVTRELGLCVPSFQSPPRSDTLDRTIHRRGSSDDCVVAVRVRGRPFAAVVADAIEGVVVCNELAPAEACAVRNELWQAAEPTTDTVQPTPAPHANASTGSSPDVEAPREAA